MEQQKEQKRPMAVAKYIQQLRNNTMRYTKEMVDLVEADLNYGLTIDQTQIYAKPEYEYAQMKILSDCLRKGTDQEFIDLLIKYPKINGYQMQVALEFYEKGVPIKGIEDVIAKGEMAKNMRTYYEEILNKMDEVKKEAGTEPEYVKELVEKIETAVEKIRNQDERYDKLNDLLLELENGKKDDEVREELVKKLTETEANLSSQQDQLNHASSVIARLKDQIEHKDKEIGRMQNRIDTLEDKLLEKASEREPVKEPNVEMNKEMEQTGQQTIMESNFQIPVYYNIPIVDGVRTVASVPVDRSIKRSGSNGMACLISKLGFKKRSRQDIVKLVAGGNLVPAQLVQIKNAILNGLTEEQLVELINNNVSAEKMKEIIEIAVIENKMDY